MNKLLLLRDENGASGDELYQIMSRYVESRNSSCFLKTVREITYKDIAAVDIIICIRGATPFMKKIINMAKKMNKFVIYFLDDSLKDMPDNTFLYPKRKMWHLECVRLADVLLTTNPLIEEDYKKYIKDERTAIINTAVNSIAQKKQSEYQRKQRIVYAGSEWHVENYKLFLEPIIYKLLEANKEELDLYFVGFDPNIIGFEESVHVVQKMNLEKYQKFMNQMDFDIGLAPLKSSYFTERKYFNKFIEYTRNGICGIYSDVYPYRFVVNDGENGYLVEDNADAWLESITRVLNNRTDRSRCVENAQTYLKNNHSDKFIFENLERDIPEITTNIRSHKIRHKLFMDKLFLYYPFWLNEKMYMTKFSLKNEGLMVTIKRIMKKIR